MVTVHLFQQHANTPVNFNLLFSATITLSSCQTREAKHESWECTSQTAPAENCAQPAMYDYFKAKFDSISGELKSTELAFKAARYFSPSKLNELEPATSDTHTELVSLPWCKSKSTDM